MKPANISANDGQTTPISLQAWQRLLEKLAASGQAILGEHGAVDARERAEGFRNLTRLLHIGLDLYLEHADPARPTFTGMLTPTRKFGGDNPDTTYDYATLDRRYGYRLHGNRGHSLYLGICVYGKTADFDGEPIPFIGAKLSDHEIVYDEAGAFEIILSAQRPAEAKNWLELKEGTDSMIVRQYYTDDRSAPATYQIELLSPAPAWEPYNEALFVSQLDKVGDFVKDTSETSAALSLFAALNTIESDESGVAKKHEALDFVDGQVQARSGSARAQALVANMDMKVALRQLPAPDIQYSGAWWQLKPGEVVVIEGEAAPARYWSVQTFNRWMESGEYRYQTAYINSERAVVNPDGRFSVVLAAENPGVENWISTQGFQHGHVCFRALLAEKTIAVQFRIASMTEFQTII